MEDLNLPINDAGNSIMCDIVLENNTDISYIKHVMKDLETQDDLARYGPVLDFYMSYFSNIKCLEIYVESLVSKATSCLSSNGFNISNFFCQFCGNILKDPVTLNCGHTFSRECVLLKSAIDSYQCVKCLESYSHTCLVQLKDNVLVRKLIHKVWKDKAIKHSNPEATFNLYSLFFSIINNSNMEMYKDFTENPSPKNFVVKANLLARNQKYKEAIYLYLIYSVLIPSAADVKQKIVNFLYELLHKSEPRSSQPTLIDLTVRNKDGDNQECTKSIENQDLCLLIKKFCSVIDKMARAKLFQMDVFQRHEFECSLCLQMFLDPITTSCGHTFCKRCLYRSLDYKSACPLCKSELCNYFIEHTKGITDFILSSLKTFFPDDYLQREAAYLKEMKELFHSNQADEHVLPLFVCTTTFPNIPCPLHIFEPRYRLMIRQCIESGSFKFGMCAFIDNNISEYGTVLEIIDVSFFPDGRSVVYTVGRRRFRVLSKTEKDGYSVATVKYLKDENFCVGDEFREAYNHLYKTAESWFKQVPQDTKSRILKHLGPMPELETNLFSNSDGPTWIWWVIAVLPLEVKLQALLLSMTSLARRLKALERIFLQI